MMLMYRYPSCIGGTSLLAFSLPPIHLLGQWLQPKSHLCILSWVKNPKVKAILDTYHAPYKPKYRYWTGLLLLIRCALFLVFAFNISGDDSINLLVISLTTSRIFVWFALLGKAYKSWYLDALELSFILNLGILAVTTYHNLVEARVLLHIPQLV